MMTIFNDINEARKNLKTYKVGLLQTKAYRNLKNKTGLALKPFSISSIEWAFLGIASEFPLGIKSNDLAIILGVEAPYITALASKFEKKKLLKYLKDEKDGRVKKIALTSEGQALVQKIEVLLRTESKKWLKGISMREVITFIKVLRKLNED